jgi:hypothetical protein
MKNALIAFVSISAICGVLIQLSFSNPSSTAVASNPQEQATPEAKPEPGKQVQPSPTPVEQTPSVEQPSSEEQASTEGAEPTGTANSAGILGMVMVDQAKLSAEQKAAFQTYLQTANLPPTKIGNKCQYYGKPAVWCLLLDPTLAQQIYERLKAQPIFGSLVELKEVGRINGPDKNVKK